MYSKNEIKLMKCEAKALKLSAPDSFTHGKDKDLVEICNGVGSERMPLILVDALSFIYRHYKTAQAIHDCRYNEAHKTEFTQEQADAEFYANCKKIWKSEYGFLRFILPSSIRDFFRIRTAYIMLKRFGRLAWIYCEDINKAEAVQIAEGAYE